MSILINIMTSFCQFGVCPDKSSKDALDYLITELLNKFEDNSYIEVTSCDLTKAFDCVNFEMLLKKLYIYGIRDVEYKFLASFLTGRSFMVDVNGKRSQTDHLNHGVPHGFILGPFLFLITINDLDSNV